MSEAQRLHGHLIGQQGSRRSLNTPALVLDLEMLDRNIAEMAAFAKAHGMKLRPHSKTHKSADIARRQVAAGALGVCCAKLGEAEALGEQVILVPPHCDPTVNMYESYHVVKGDTLVEIWPVTARGRSR